MVRLSSGLNRPRQPQRRRPEVELLEDRLVMSWAGVPPSLITPPGSAVAVSLNSQLQATGNSSIASNEVDYYTFLAPTSGSFRLSALTPSSNLDPVLGVYNSSGNRLAYNDDITSTNTDSQLSINLTAGNRYFFGITNYSSTAGGSYTWSVAGPTTGTADDSFENNDTLAQASNLGTLTARRTINNLAMRDNADWFRFATTATGTTSNDVAINFQHSQGDLDLRLYNSAGTLLRTSDGVANSERVSLNGLAAGTYYIEVYGYRGATNPTYSLDINPIASAPPTTGNRVLYLVTEGANIARTDLVRWAGSDWAGMVNQFDSDRNGITVQRFLGSRTDREQVITRMISLIQADLSPFGIRVVRHTGAMVEGQGATTIFLGQSSLTNGLFHVACDIDQGNNNRTDIAFVGNENWGSVEATALGLADTTLHEAGHTFGLWHVNTRQNGVVYPESMGLRYTLGPNNSSQWIQNTSFMDRTFVAYVDENGSAHGPGPQNSFQSMARNFGTAAATPSAQAVQVDTSRQGVFSLTTSASADRVSVRRQGFEVIEVTINGQNFSLIGNQLREIHIYTLGDGRDRIQAINSLGNVRLFVHAQTTGDLHDREKLPATLASLWNGSSVDRHDHEGHAQSNGCVCGHGGATAGTHTHVSALPEAVTPRRHSHGALALNRARMVEARDQVFVQEARAARTGTAASATQTPADAFAVLFAELGRGF